MDQLIEGLEERIRRLIQQCDQLRVENDKITRSKAQLQREKDVLLAKNRHAITQIELMVTRLKSLEKSQ